MLREKWRDELKNRFGISAQMMDAGELLKNLSASKDNLLEGKAIVCSLQGIRPPKNWNDEDAAPSSRRDLARLLDHQSQYEPLIDLLVIDEAHYLRNPESQSAKLGHLLREVSNHVVLLSATPINLRNEDLYYLVNLVDPDFFVDAETFPLVLKANEPLIRAREIVLDTRRTAADVRDELEEAKERLSDLFHGGSHQLDNILDNEILGADALDKYQRIRLANQIEQVNLLKHAVTRTKKSEVTEWQVVRDPKKRFVELDKDGPEWEFYQKITDAVREYAEREGIHEGFLLASPQRQVSSCMYAAAKSWQKPARFYEEQMYEDLGSETAQKDQIAPLTNHLCSTVMRDVNIEVLRENDSKYEEFRRAVLECLNKNKNEKIVVFAYFRGALTYIKERLEEDCIRSQVLMGGMQESKQEIIERFRDNKDIRILLSSEVASEGVDLQFCRILINYDLPWNPMKIEQRIGRIDRIGQNSDRINIINLFFRDTIDHRIHERLYERLDIFKRALGDMGAILGEEVNKLTSNLFSRKLTNTQEQDRIDQTAMAVEQIRHQQETLEKNASHLIAHGSYILDKVNAARHLKKRILGEDLALYAKGYLNKYAPGRDFTQHHENDLLYDIRLPAENAARLSEFIRGENLFGQTQLASGGSVSCLFTNKVIGYNRKYEEVSQFHPFIRFIGAEYKEKNETFYPLVSVELADSDVNAGAGIYVFFIKLWEFAGLKTEEEMPMRAINLDTKDTLTLEDSWELINQVRISGKDWLSAAGETDNEAVKSCLEKCESLLIKDFGEAQRQRDNENKDRVNFQKQSAIRHRDRQLRSSQNALDKLIDSGKTRLIPATEARIENIKRKFDVKLSELDLKAKLNASQHDVCVGVLRVR